MLQVQKQVVIIPPKIEVKPVCWSGEKPIKYQAQVTVIRPNGDKKILIGDPMSTEEAAKTSLVHEVLQRQEDIMRIKEVLENLSWL